MPIEEFDHYTVRAADFDASWRFYGEVLGLRCESRPGMPVRAGIVSFGPGDRWLVHLFAAQADASTGAPVSAQSAEPRTGALVHIATNATDLAEMRARLDKHGWSYRERTLEARALRQIHLLDPDGIEIEVNFPLSEHTG